MSVIPQVPERLSLAVSLMESTVEAVEGRLKSPSKKQGIICRTLLKALLMECFAWLPPGTFPSSSERLFEASLSIDFWQPSFLMATIDRCKLGPSDGEELNASPLNLVSMGHLLDLGLYRL